MDSWLALRAPRNDEGGVSDPLHTARRYSFSVAIQSDLQVLRLTGSASGLSSRRRLSRAVGGPTISAVPRNTPACSIWRGWRHGLISAPAVSWSRYRTLLRKQAMTSRSATDAASDIDFACACLWLSQFASRSRSSLPQRKPRSRI